MPEERFIETNGIKLHVVLDGPPEGAPVLLLHGFPEIWRCWHHQMDALVAQGYRVIAPDQRGYNLSDKPKGVRNYAIEKLIADIAGLLDVLGYDQVDLIGHDWGAVIAACFAEAHPQRLKHLVISNGMHTNHLARAFLTNPMQFFKSWYISFFQLPLLPEYLLKRGFGRRFLASSSSGSFSAEELDRLEQAWAQPGAPTAMINWYRAAYRVFMRELGRALLRFRNPYNSFPPPVITVPSLVLWGVHDTFLTKGLAEAFVKSCQDGQVQYFSDASH